MKVFDPSLVDRWFSSLLDPDSCAEYSSWLRPDPFECAVLAAGRGAIRAALEWAELPSPRSVSAQVDAAQPAAAVLAVYLTGLATGVAGARQTMAINGDLDGVPIADRLCLVAGLIAAGAAVSVEPGPAGLTVDASELARAAGTAAAELVVDGADLRSITSAAAASALSTGPADDANRESGYRARALIAAVLVCLARSAAPSGAPIRLPSCGSKPGVNGGVALLAEVTFTMFLQQQDSDRLQVSLASLAQEVVVWAEADRRYFHVHTVQPGEVVAQSYAVGTVFSLVIGRLD